jgi:hypothetical protein
MPRMRMRPGPVGAICIRASIEAAGLMVATSKPGTVCPHKAVIDTAKATNRFMEDLSSVHIARPAHGSSTN